jgi:hypothetical protein
MLFLFLDLGNYCPVSSIKKPGNKPQFVTKTLYQVLWETKWKATFPVPLKTCIQGMYTVCLNQHKAGARIVEYFNISSFTVEDTKSWHWGSPQLLQTAPLCWAPALGCKLFQDREGFAVHITVPSVRVCQVQSGTHQIHLDLSIFWMENASVFFFMQQVFI